MAFISIRCWWIKITCLVFVLNLLSEKVIGQSKVLPDSILTKVMNSNFSQVSISDIFKKNKNLVIISNDNCTGCAKYFTKEKKQFNFIFILFGESLLEARRLQRVHGLLAEQCFFTTCEMIKDKKKELCQEPTPCLIKLSGSNFLFYDYPQLSQFTVDFGLSSAALAKKLKE